MCHKLDCPDVDGFYAHPIDCHKYVKCTNGKAFTEVCPANLHYNSARGMCDHKKDVQVSMFYNIF